MAEKTIQINEGFGGNCSGARKSGAKFKRVKFQTCDAKIGIRHNLHLLTIKIDTGMFYEIKEWLVKELFKSRRDFAVLKIVQI